MCEDVPPKGAGAKALGCWPLGAYGQDHLTNLSMARVPCVQFTVDHSKGKILQLLCLPVYPQLLALPLNMNIIESLVE